MEVIGQYTACLRYGIFRRRVWFDFDMLAWFILYDDFGWQFEEIHKHPHEELMTRLLFAAAKSHALKKGLKFCWTMPGIVKVLEKSRTVDSERLKTVFVKSSRDIPGMITEKIAGGSGEGKKKQHGMTS